MHQGWQGVLFDRTVLASTLHLEQDAEAPHRLQTLTWQQGSSPSMKEKMWHGHAWPASDPPPSRIARQTVVHRTPRSSAAVSLRWHPQRQNQRLSASCQDEGPHRSSHVATCFHRLVGVLQLCSRDDLLQACPRNMGGATEPQRTKLRAAAQKLQSRIRHLVSREVPHKLHRTAAPLSCD